MTDHTVQNATQCLRWVLLKHTTAEGYHWDFMLEPSAGAKLLTWHMSVSPAQWLSGVQDLIIERISDHRPIYLTYEGDISGNRGHVVQESAGTWRPTRMTETCIEGVLDNRCRIGLSLRDGSRWRLNLVSEGERKATGSA